MQAYARVTGFVPLARGLKVNTTLQRPQRGVSSLQFGLRTPSRRRRLNVVKETSRLLDAWREAERAAGAARQAAEQAQEAVEAASSATEAAREAAEDAGEAVEAVDRVATGAKKAFHTHAAEIGADEEQKRP